MISTYGLEDGSVALITLCITLTEDQSGQGVFATHPKKVQPGTVCV
jgi:hypothetical protein